MNPILEKISLIGIVPVIAIDDVDKAVPLAHALVAGGIPCAEVTFRTKEGEEAIRRMTQEVPEILVGAGTVLTTEQVDRAVAAGAKFIVSPGLNPKVVAYCNEKNIPITPGCANPSDIEQAIELGLEVVKFFPAEQAGGLAYIKSISAPYNKMRFMPTGGINQVNMLDYLAFNKILACGGSWMVSKELLNAGNFSEITRLCKEAVWAMLGFKLAHIGINPESDANANKTAAFFEKLFNFKAREGSSSIFSGSIESMKEPYIGKHGHIAIGTLRIKSAVDYLKHMGVEFREDSIKTSGQGELIAVYLKEEIAGFGVHLVQQ